jgi:MYXO-CTERM domain-containing protein
VHQAGIEFAFIRATDGVQYLDPKFAEYWSGARAAGVMRGAYQFFRPAEDPIAQADLLLQTQGALEPNDLPPVIDVEVSGGLTPAEVTAAVRAWVDHVTTAIGRPPIIYAGLYSWHDLTASADFTTSPLWVAQYTTAACPDIPTPWTRWELWQDTSMGSVAGIPGSTLDLDVFNGTFDELVTFTMGGVPMCRTIPAVGGEIDDTDPCFTEGGPPQLMRHVAGSGEQGELIWTHTTDASTEANFGQWDLDLETSGRYRVEVFTPRSYATSKRAGYVIRAAGRSTTVMIDQSAVDGWQSLGEIDFAAGGDQSIHLGDNTGEPATQNAQLVFDAVRLTRIDDTSPDGRGCSSIDSRAGWFVAALALFVARRRRYFVGEDK